MSALLRSCGAVVALVVLGLTIGACSSDTSGSRTVSTTGAAAKSVTIGSCEDASKPPSADVSGTVRTILEEVPDADIVRRTLIPAFNKEYPNVKIEIESAAYDVIHDKVVASFQAGDPRYDLVPVDNPWAVDMASAGYLEDLGPRIACLEDYAYDDFPASLRDLFSFEGGVFGLSYYSYPLGFVRRVDLLPDAPTTLDELVRQVEGVTRPGLAGIAQQPQRGYKIEEEWGNLLFAAGGRQQDAEGRFTLDTPEAKKALETYIQLHENAAPKNSLNWGFDEAVRAVASGKAASLITYALFLATLNTEGNSDYPGKFELSPIPGGRGVNGAWSWAIPKNSKANDAAWAWISWVTSREADRMRVIAGGAPTRMSTMEDPEVWEQGYGQQYYETYADILTNAVPLCFGFNCPEAVQKIGAHLNAAVAGIETVDEALAGAERDANAAIGK